MGSKQWVPPARAAASHDGGALGNCLRVLLDFNVGHVDARAAIGSCLLYVQRDLEARR